jgi:hypothetical protein
MAGDRARGGLPLHFYKSIQSGQKLLLEKISTFLPPIETLNQAYIDLRRVIPCTYYQIIEDVCP